MTEQLAHSTIGASSMDRWSACPGSVRLSKGMPNTSSEFAEEGTRAHVQAALALLGQAWAPETDEMEDAIDTYVAHCLGVWKDTGGDLLVEHRFNLESLHPGLFGTADCVVWNPKTKVLTVIDFKYGKGIAVEARGNQQLQYYALGAYLSLKYDVDYVDIVIVQPRCSHELGPVRTWRICIFDLLEFQADLLCAAKATEAPDAPLVTGDHCRFCPAAGVCPQVKAESFALATQVFSPVETYDPAALARTLDKIDVVEGWCSGVRAFAYSEAQHGRCPPGYKLVDKRPVRKWTDKISDMGIAKQLACATSEKNKGRDTHLVFYETPGLKSPAQVEKILKGFGVGKDALGELVVKASSGVKLVRESEPGERQDVDAASVFTYIEPDPFS